MTRHNLQLYWLSGFLLLNLPLLAAPIHDAARKGDVQALQTALNGGANINVRDKRGASPLQLAIMSRRYEAARFLIKKGAEVNTQDKDGGSPLYWAATHRKTKDNLVAELLAKGADPNLENRFGQPVIFGATSLEALQLIIDKEVEVDPIDNLKTTPLSRRANSNEVVPLLELLIKHGADVNGRGEQVPLIQAAMGGRNNNVELLLKHGADPMQRDSRQRTALHYPSSATIVNFLLQKGADPNVQDRDQNTPLHNTYRASVARLLLDAGADINAVNKFKKTPLDSAQAKYDRAKKDNKKERVKQFEELLKALKAAAR